MTAQDVFRAETASSQRPGTKKTSPACCASDRAQNDRFSTGPSGTQLPASRAHRRYTRCAIFWLTTPCDSVSAPNTNPVPAGQNAVAARYAGWRVKCAVTDTVAGALTMIPILFQVIP